VRPIIDTPRPSQALSNAVDAPPQRSGFDQLGEIAEQTLALLRRQRRLFGAVSGGMLAALAIAILLQTPLYESTALMLVKFGRELVYQPEIGSDQSFATRDKETVINSELAILRSQPVIEGVVNQIGLEKLYPGLAEQLPQATPGSELDEALARERWLLVAEATERLRLGLSAQALPDAEVLQVSFQHPDPIVAAETVNVLVDRFLDAHLSAFSEPEIVVFLTQRVEEYEQRLAESEGALREFEVAHPAFAFDSPQQMLLQSRDEQRAGLREIETQMASIRLRHLQEDGSGAEARTQLLALQVEASRLRGDAKREIEGQIQVVNRFIETRKREMGEELKLLENKIAPLQESLAKTESELAQLPTLSPENRRLRRDRDADEEQYRIYRRRLRDARLSGEMDQAKIASINVIQPASPSPRPVWPPSKAVSLTIAAVLALIAGGLAVALMDRIGPTGIAWLDPDPEENPGA
jgi:uncharacterized protein involved in exopolysaccharide biosynthesis